MTRLDPAMRIAFYAPFRPLGHPRVSGDVTIARDLAAYFQGRGHHVFSVSDFCAEKLNLRPWRWPRAWLEARRALGRCKEEGAELWFTYHSYYRSPDLLGPLARDAGLVYVNFACSYASKRRRHWKTRWGYYQNKKALVAADHLFHNKRVDIENCARILPRQRMTYIRPGINTADFVRDETARLRFRSAWGDVSGETPVVMAVAMMRPGVKVQGLAFLLDSLGRLAASGRRFKAVLVGDGPARAELEARAEALGLQAVFLGKVPRQELAGVYSAGDVYAFPGISEGLGMAYLEAQACGLPCVAFDHDGAPEVVDDGVSGHITPSFDEAAFDAAIARLLDDEDLRRTMGEAAMAYVRREHELTANYAVMEGVMEGLVASRRRAEEAARLPRNGRPGTAAGPA